MSECRFRGDTDVEWCRLLDVTHCPENCKFRKTEREFQDGLRNAMNILGAKGLVAYSTINDQGVRIVSTRSVE
nr:MAG TPA: hypothetical protein [Caudoviricetes sp.]